MSIDIIIPLYNKTLKEIPVLSVAINDQRAHCIICDNSTDAIVKEKNISDSACLDRLTYIDMKGNAGISKAYNRALEKGTSELICLFDDDTKVSSSYIDCILSAHEKHPEAILVPIVKSDNKVLSPLACYGPIIKRCRKLNKISESHITAFNTGLAIPRKIIMEIGFDEGQFLDFVDHAFFRKAHRRKARIQILHNVELRQDYSADTDSLDKALDRISIQIKDIKNYYSCSKLDRAYACVYTAYLRMKKTLKFKTSKFLVI